MTDSVLGVRESEAPRPRGSRRHRFGREFWRRVLIYLVLGGFAIVMIFPFVYMFFTSLKTPAVYTLPFPSTYTGSPATTVLVNVRVPPDLDVLSIPAVEASAAAAKTALDGSGRILLRASGTEPVVRVMVEGRDHGLVRDVARRVAGDVEQAIKAA